MLVKPTSNVKKMAAIGIAGLFLSGCNTANVKSSMNEFGANLKSGLSDLHESIDYETLLTIGGAVAGAALCDKDSRAVCAAVGGLAGNLIGKHVEEQKAKLQALKETGKVEFEHATISTANSTGGDNGNVIAVKETNLFASGQSQPTKAGKEKYKLIADTYKDTQQSVLIIGHSDASGSSEGNQLLSEKRAKAIAKIFVGQGVPEEKIFYQGAGESRPIASNATREGRTQNRRVEVVSVSDTLSLLAYDQSESSSPDYLKHKTTTPKEAAKIEQVSQSSQKVAQAKTSASNDSSKVDTSGVIVDFGGRYAERNVTDLYAAIGNATTPSQSWSLFSKAYASDEVAPAGSCYEDNPRQSGPIKSIGGGELKRSADYSSSDFNPQMNRSSWVSMVNGHFVGLAPVAILKETGDAVSEPKMLVYQDYSSNPKNKADHILSKSVTNTYSGENGVLMRTYYLDDNSPVKCIDVVMSKQRETIGSSLAGSLFYESDDAVLMAEFKPSVVKKK